MKKSDIDIERAIEKILFLASPQKELSISAPKRRRGRIPTRADIPVWSLSFYNPSCNRTFALISMCIKEDFSQTIEQLACKIATCKSRPPSECLAVLKELRARGLLGYYDNNCMFRVWREEGRRRGLENLCS